MKLIWRAETNLRYNETGIGWDQSTRRVMVDDAWKMASIGDFVERVVPWTSVSFGIMCLAALLPPGSIVWH